MQEYVQYASKISGGDIDFLATLDAENGTRDPKRQSSVWSYYDRAAKRNVICRKNNRDNRCRREDSRGFCQQDRRRHSKTVDDPRFFTDPKRQIETCYKKYK